MARGRDRRFPAIRRTNCGGASDAPIGHGDRNHPGSVMRRGHVGAWLSSDSRQSGHANRRPPDHAKRFGHVGAWLSFRREKVPGTAPIASREAKSAWLRSPRASEHQGENHEERTTFHRSHRPRAHGPRGSFCLGDRRPSRPAPATASAPQSLLSTRDRGLRCFASARFVSFGSTPGMRP